MEAIEGLSEDFTLLIIAHRLTTLKNCTQIVELGVHVMNDTEADPLTAFRTVNVDGTLNLARQAAAAGSSDSCSSVQSR